MRLRSVFAPTPLAPLLRSVASGSEPSLRLSPCKSASLLVLATLGLVGSRPSGEKPASLRDLSFRLASETSANFLKKFPSLPARPPALHRKLPVFALSPSPGAEPLHFANAPLRGLAFCRGASSSFAMLGLAGSPLLSTQSNPSLSLPNNVSTTNLLGFAGTNKFWERSDRRSLRSQNLLPCSYDKTLMFLKNKPSWGDRLRRSPPRFPMQNRRFCIGINSFP